MATSSPPKVERYVGVPASDYEHAMNSLNQGKPYYFTDREGNEDEVILINGEIIEISTGRKVVNMDAMIKNKPDDAKVAMLSTFGRLMTTHDLVQRLGPLIAFKEKTSDKVVVYNSHDDSIVCEAVFPAEE